MNWEGDRSLVFMAGEDLIELKFRLFDGSDIGPDKYDPATTVAALKETIVSRWPQVEGSRRSIDPGPFSL